MSFESFISTLHQLLPAERIITDEVRCYAFGIDASCFALTPKAVLRIHSEYEMSAVLRLSSAHQVALTFRGGGTSVSGQATSDSVLVLLSSAWTGYRIDPLAERLHLQPAVTFAQAKRMLAPYGRQLNLQSTPADTATIGGLAANGALSVLGARLILADGAVIDSRDENSVDAFRGSHAPMLAQLAALRRDILSDADLAGQIRQASGTYRTTGYNLRALLEYNDPLDILIQLIAGSEGTLGFISEVTVATVEQPKHRAAVLAGFHSVADGLAAIKGFPHYERLRADVVHTRQMSAIADWASLLPFCTQLDENGCVVFITVQGASSGDLQDRVHQFSNYLAQLGCVGFSDMYWGPEGIRQTTAIKRSLLSSVVAARSGGSVPVYQSYRVPTDCFESSFRQLSDCLSACGYEGATVTGSVTTDQLDLIVCPVFASDQDRARFVQFQRQVEALIQSSGGTLAAGQGVGRLNAVGLRSLCGDPLYSLQQQIKAVLDPDNRLNPGVVLVTEEQAIESQLKVTPVVNDKIDACTACGLCESVCVGRGVDFTARQKIAVHREIEARKAQKREVPKHWEDQFKARALDSCVTTGLCEQACPMSINTGEWVLELRAVHNYRYQRLAWAYARHFAALSSWLRGSLRLIVSFQRLFGAERVEAFSRRLRRLSGNRTPLILTTTPGRSQPVYSRNELINLSGENTVVYWPSCISQSFGKALADDREHIPAVVQRVLKKADLNVVYPQPTRGLCCGQTLMKRGFEEVADHMLEELLAALWDISSAGRYPVLADTSACSLRVKARALARGIHLYDSSEFIDKFLLNRLQLVPEEQKIAVHVTCSTRKLAAESSFYRVLNRVAPNWVEPAGIECCGYANEKGFMDPELSEQALKSLPDALQGCVYGVSNSRTCEIGLSRYSGLTYYSLFELLDRHSEALSGALE